MDDQQEPLVPNDISMAVVRIKAHRASKDNRGSPYAYPIYDPWTQATHWGCDFSKLSEDAEILANY
jgi:hypothetical protein